MSTLGPEATELLTGKSQPAAAGAVPQPEPSPAGGAAPASPTGQPEPGKTVPLEALVSEQRNTAAARQALADRDARLQAMGFGIGEDGSLIPPAPAAPPGVAPRLQALADQLGVAPDVIQGAFEDMAGPFAAPIASGTAEVYKTMLADKDPDFEVYKGDIDKHLNQLPANIRAHPQAVQFAVKLAKADHIEKLVERGMERKEKGQGKVVGKFVEGAAPGTQEGPAPKPLSEGTLEWMRRSYTPEEIAAKEAVRGGR